MRVNAIQQTKKTFNSNVAASQLIAKKTTPIREMPNDTLNFGMAFGAPTIEANRYSEGSSNITIINPDKFSEYRSELTLGDNVTMLGNFNHPKVKLITGKNFVFEETDSTKTWHLLDLESAIIGDNATIKGDIRTNGLFQAGNNLKIENVISSGEVKFDSILELRKLKLLPKENNAGDNYGKLIFNSMEIPRLINVHLGDLAGLMIYTPDGSPDILKKLTFLEAGKDAKPISEEVIRQCIKVLKIK